MYTTHNAFPYNYHPDEAGKAQQILSQGEYRNFNHPQLLLESTEWATWWFQTPADAQAVVEVGRTVSGVMTALAVVALSLSGYIALGLPGLISVTPVVALCPFLLAYSHSMKEDAALGFGISIVVLGTCLLWQWGNRQVLQWLAMVVLAVGVATAMSAKYVGAVAIVVAIPALLFAPRTALLPALLRPVVFISWLLLAVIAINHRAISDFDQFSEGLEREYEHSVTDHMGLTMNRPNLYIVNVTRDATPLFLQAMLMVGAVLWITFWRRKHRMGWDRCVLLLAGGFLLVLSYGVIAMDRYALPVVMLVALLAGIGTARLGQFIGKPWAKWGLPITFASVTIVTQGPICADYIRQFGDDSRQRLREFILNEPTMAGTRILAEQYTGLNGPAYDGSDDGLRSRANISSRMFAAELRSIESARRMGFTHIAVADFAYGRYFDPHVFPSRGETNSYNRSRTFYEELFRDGQLVWSYEPTHRMTAYTNPTVRLYAITDR